jgi:hypothetical protein
MKQRLVCLDPVLPIDSGGILTLARSTVEPTTTTVPIHIQTDKITFVRREGKKMLFSISYFYAILTNLNTI